MGAHDSVGRSQDGLRIRAARPGDEALVLEFVRELAEYERLSHEVVATEADFAQALFGQPRRAEVLLADFDGRPAGFALFFFTYSTFAGKAGLYLEDLFVRPEYRGQGVGVGLLRQLAVVAGERGCARMEWVVLDWNQPAIDFYERLGARSMGDWKTYRLEAAALASLAAAGTAAPPEPGGAN
jgi:GNAT superfamily N-acetyltransferase